MSIRKILYIIAAVTVLSFTCVNSSTAQHYIGGRIGYGTGTARFYPKVEMGSATGLYSGGFSWKYYSRERYVGAVQMDVMFMQQGYKELEYQYTKERTYERKVNSVMIPFFWQPHAYFFKRRARVFLNLGVTFSYNFSSTYKLTEPDGTITEGDYDMSLSKDNPLGYGLCGGLGAGWLWDRWEVFGEFRYYIGYGDIYRNRNKYRTDDLNHPLRSPLDGMQFSVGVYYRLGQGGIKSLPSARVAAKLDNLETLESMEREMEEVKVSKKEERRLRKEERRSDRLREKLIKDNERHTEERLRIMQQTLEQQRQEQEASQSNEETSSENVPDPESTSQPEELQTERQSESSVVEQ